MKASKTGSIVSLLWQNDRGAKPICLSVPQRALASEATFLTPAHQPKTEKKRERKRQKADRAGVGEKSQRRVADYPLHRLSNQPVFQTEIPPTASVQRTDRAKKIALLSSKLHGGVDEHSEASTRRGTRATSAEVVRSYRAGGRPNCDQERFGRYDLGTGGHETRIIRICDQQWGQYRTTAAPVVRG